MSLRGTTTRDPQTSRLTVVYPKMPNTNSLVNTRATLVNSRPSPSVGNAIRSQSLVNSRHHSSNAHASAPVPTLPLPSRKSPKIMQILLQTIRTTLVISRETHVNTRHTLIKALVCSRRPSHPDNPSKIMQTLLQTIRPTLVTSRATHVNTRHTLIPALVCSRRPSHPENPSKIMQIQLQTIRPTLVRALVCSRPLSTCLHPHLSQARPPPKRHPLS